MSDDQPMYTDSKGKQYRSKHEIPASELMTAFYQDMVGISQGLAEELDTAQERIAALEAALRALVERSQIKSPLDIGIHVDKSRTHTTHCLICGYSVEDSGHREGCPVVLARKLLGDEA